jgi:hypothetical protein
MRQWVQAQAEDRRRPDVVTYQDLRREREAQWRREQQELDAYQAARQRIVQAHRQQQQEERRTYQVQLSQWSQDQRLRAEAETARWQQASQTIDDLLRLSQR